MLWLSPRVGKLDRKTRGDSRGVVRFPAVLRGLALFVALAFFARLFPAVFLILAFNAILRELLDAAL